MDDLELIKSKINIVDLVQEYLPLKKAGVNYKAPCPFHPEKTPSFMVSPERGIFHCFGCQKGGDIFKFVMEKEGVEFKEALDILAQKAGVKLKRSAEGSKHKDKLFEVNEKASQFYHHLLTAHPLGKEALKYLLKRGLTEQTIKKFKLGYSPNSWDSLTKFLTKRGYLIKDLIEVGLVVPSARGGYDRFRGRIMYPLIDVKNQILGFSGRVLLSGEPKYINSPQTVLFDKSKFFYGLNSSKGEVRQKNAAILVEGEMDMLMSYQSGVENIVATKGTALTQDQLEIIKKYTDTILLCFDKDLAGDAAIRRGIEMADSMGFTIRVVKIEGGKDPAEMSLSDPDSWKKAVDTAEPVYDYYFSSSILRFNPKTAEGKRSIATELLPILRTITDTFTKEHYIQKLASLLGVDDKLLRTQLKSPQLPQSHTSPQPSLSPQIKKNDSISRTRQELLEEYLIALLIKIPSDITYVPSFPETLLLSEDLRSIYVLLVIYLDAISFKGKSFNIKEFVSSAPEELQTQIDRLYLIDVSDKLSDSKSWKEEVDNVVAQLKRALLKASLEKLSLDIKNAQAFGRIEQLETLNRRFRDLSVKLKSL